jgi:hypothetical protein
MNQVHDGVRKSDHDSGKKSFPQGPATASKMEKWIALCHWDRQDDEYDGPIE